ncbi:MAG: hypothetical protein FJ257_03090 [Phycisphaerae bacterium]|nr:hypothetical protein [Phycisphaerae bacterium]
MSGGDPRRPVGTPPAAQASKNARPAPPPRCPACGRPLEVIDVHGHGQCRFCGTNIDPCCQGGPIAPEGLR